MLTTLYKNIALRLRPLAKHLLTTGALLKFSFSQARLGQKIVGLSLITGSIFGIYYGFRSPSPPKPGEPNWVTPIPGLTPSGLIYQVFANKQGGNIGFVTLNDGVTPDDLSRSLLAYGDKVYNHMRSQDSEQYQTAPGGWHMIVLQNVYGNTASPELTRDPITGEPTLVPTITQDNFDQILSKNKIPEDVKEQVNGLITLLHGDGLVINKVNTVGDKQLLATIPYADAHPVTLYDPTSGIVGMVALSHHALAKGMLQQVAKEMKNNGAKPENIVVAIGPGLATPSYSIGRTGATVDKLTKGGVDKRDRQPFIPLPHANECIVSDDSNKYLDIEKAIKNILFPLGIQLDNIYNVGVDTRTTKDPDNNGALSYFSARGESDVRKLTKEDRAQESANQYPNTARQGSITGIRKKRLGL